MMEQIAVKPIDTRKWNKPQSRLDLVFERDKNRKKSQQKVDERIHYMWFNYLQLCLDLERINYGVPKRGGRGKIVSTTEVKVSKDIYRKWDLEKVKKSSFREWYNDGEHRLLFYEGGFRHTRGTQYHPLVKRFNVFIQYTNMMNDKNFYLKGDDSKGMKVSEKIVEGLQKERYDLLDRKDFDKLKDTSHDRMKIKENMRKLSNQKRVMKDVVDCENSILAVCQGRFPK
jgi:hypothetical protein